MERRVFQTVRATSNLECLKKNAPFYCREKTGYLKEWLGEGYYFWETFELLARWWGKVKYLKKGVDYAVCATRFCCRDELILDLVSNTEQMLDIQEIVEELKKTKEFQAKDFTAQFIINLIREKSEVKFKAIRAWGCDCSNDKEIKKFTFGFNTKATLHICPEIQICVLDKSVIDLPMEVIYHSNYFGSEWFTV